MIAGRNLFVSYAEGRRKHPALVDFSFSVREGEFVCVMGPNGSGKSTLARLMKGLMRPQAGTLTLDGEDATGARGNALLRRAVGLVFENPTLQIVAPVVEEDLLFGLENLGVDAAEARRRIDEVADRLSIAHLLDRAIEDLSSGEAQRVALAGVLVMKPRFLVSDESTAWLDPPSRMRVIELFRELARDGVGIVHITHDPREAVAADRVMVLDGGTLVREGTPRDVFASSYSLVKRGVRVPLAALVTERARELGARVDHPALTAADLETHLRKA